MRVIAVLSDLRSGSSCPQFSTGEALALGMPTEPEGVNDHRTAHCLAATSPPNYRGAVSFDGASRTPASRARGCSNVEVDAGNSSAKRAPERPPSGGQDAAAGASPTRRKRATIELRRREDRFERATHRSSEIALAALGDEGGRAAQDLYRLAAGLRLIIPGAAGAASPLLPSLIGNGLALAAIGAAIRALAREHIGADIGSLAAPSAGELRVGRAVVVLVLVLPIVVGGRLAQRIVEVAGVVGATPAVRHHEGLFDRDRGIVVFLSQIKKAAALGGRLG